MRQAPNEAYKKTNRMRWLWTYTSDIAIGNDLFTILIHILIITLLDTIALNIRTQSPNINFYIDIYIPAFLLCWKIKIARIIFSLSSLLMSWPKIHLNENKSLNFHTVNTNKPGSVEEKIVYKNEILDQYQWHQFLNIHRRNKISLFYHNQFSTLNVGFD